MFNDTVSTPRQFISDRDEADRLDLKNVIGRLGERERKIIVMRYFEDMTQQQTVLEKMKSNLIIEEDENM